jgi:hypothetical protein
MYGTQLVSDTPSALFLHRLVSIARDLASPPSKPRANACTGCLAATIAACGFTPSLAEPVFPLYSTLNAPHTGPASIEAASKTLERLLGPSKR